MPSRSQGPRLWWRKERRSKKTGKLVSNGAFLIIDDGKFIPTGCYVGEIIEARKRLAKYTLEKYEPKRQERDIESIDVADVLSIYLDDSRDEQANKKKLDERMKRLTVWWGGKMLSEVNKKNCRAYAKSRGSNGGARRDLEDLRAAINHHAEEGFHRGVVVVALPKKGAPRDRWLTYEEAARLLWVCWRMREQQKRHRGTDKGKRLPTNKLTMQHLARFILIGLYTGSRAGAIATASPVKAEGRSWVDLERGVFHRLATGKKATNKRQPPVRIPPNLLPHLRRWHQRGIAKTHFVEWNGKPVTSVKTAFARAVRAAGLAGKVMPHTLRHTAATWLMQNGTPMWQAAGFLGMTEKTLQEVYGHHHPDHMGEAAMNLGRRPNRPAPKPRRAVETLEIQLEEA
jgi:integrase